MFTKEGRADLVGFIRLYIKIYKSQTGRVPDFETMREIFKVSGIKVSDATIIRELK